MYVAFLSTHDDLVIPVDYGRSAVASVAGQSSEYVGGVDAYAGGSAVTADVGVVPRVGPTSPSPRWSWSVNSTVDLHFTADFGPAPISTVPEPASMALLGSGLAALAGWRRRRRPRDA